MEVSSERELVRKDIITFDSRINATNTICYLSDVGCWNNAFILITKIKIKHLFTPSLCLNITTRRIRGQALEEVERKQLSGCDYDYSIYYKVGNERSVWYMRAHQFKYISFTHNGQVFFVLFRTSWARGVYDMSVSLGKEPTARTDLIGCVPIETNPRGTPDVIERVRWWAIRRLSWASVKSLAASEKLADKANDRGK